jgi:hypothetical protein
VGTHTPHSWRIYCLDRKTDKVLWERKAHERAERKASLPKQLAVYIPGIHSSGPMMATTCCPSVTGMADACEALL